MGDLYEETYDSTTVRFTQAATSFTVVTGVAGNFIVVDYIFMSGDATSTVKFIDGITTGLIGPTLYFAANTPVELSRPRVKLSSGGTLAVTTTGTNHHIYVRYHLAASRV